MDIGQILIGESAVISKLRKDLPKIAGRKDNLIILGERGTGKMTIAGIIQKLASADGATLRINPHGLNDFAFRESLEKIPSREIVILPDIEEFSFLQQSLLAAALRDLPGRRTPRVIATAGTPIARLAEHNKIHSDLAEELKDYSEITVPPLSSRTEDIPLLVDSFIRNACAGTKMSLKTIDINVLDFLTRRTWKGNIVELKSVVEKAVLESRGEQIDLPSELVNESAQLDGILSNIRDKKRFSFDKALSNLEKTLIERALQLVSYNQSRAADILNLSEANLRYRMKKFRIKGQ
jgi:DNA-binding NtrC family response regulator